MRDLHDAAAAVGHQQVILAVLLIDDHVERAVAVAQLGDRRALDVGTGLEVGNGQLDQRRAGVGRQQVRLVLDVVGDERPNRRLGLEPAVRAVVDLDGRAVEAFGAERERDRDQPRGELFVGEPREEDAAVDKGQVGDRLERAACSFGGTGSVGEIGLGEADIVERSSSSLPSAVNPDQ